MAISRVSRKNLQETFMIFTGWIWKQVNALSYGSLWMTGSTLLSVIQWLSIHLRIVYMLWHIIMTGIILLFIWAGLIYRPDNRFRKWWVIPLFITSSIFILIVICFCIERHLLFMLWCCRKRSPEYLKSNFINWHFHLCPRKVFCLIRLAEWSRWYWYPVFWQDYCAW